MHVFGVYPFEYNAPLESDLQNVIYHIAVGHGGDAVRPRFGTNIIFQKKIKHGQLFYVLQYFIRTFVFADFSDTRDKSGIVPRESEARSVLIVVGYDFQSIINKYGELLNYVNGKQPNAAIFIQANLHVSKKRSDSDNYINNKNIDRLNSELSKFANGKNAFYMDANHLFDDKDGNLSSDKTADNAHLYAKYYSEWGKWICKETAKELKERQS